MNFTVRKSIALSASMSGNAMVDPFVEHLLRIGVVPKEDILSLTSDAQQFNCSLSSYLVRQRKIDATTMAKVIAEYLGLTWFDLTLIRVDSRTSGLVDVQFIRQYRVLPLFVREDRLYLAITEPAHLDVLGEIKFHTDLSVYPVVVDDEKLSRLIDTYLSQQQYQALSDDQWVIGSVSNDEKVINFVQQILLDAIQKSASDIHFEPYKTCYRIRLRIDGILHKVAQLSLDLANRITARLKIMSKLDIAERRLPQDGRFVVEVDSQQPRNCRVSTCPTLFGEKTVVRILDSHKTILLVDSLGLDHQQKVFFLNAIHKPQGMVLVTGPTGSGKTITLYTALNILNTLDKNISTVEDPIEVELAGINQVNVNTKIDLDFSHILRTFLRQDPDVVMVGEIRDKETADIAVKAAQTGHFVLSSLHTNSAAESLARLLMMGVSSFHVVHSIHLIIAQRLLRKLCDKCKCPMSIEKDLLSDFDVSEFTTINYYQAIGCEYCMKGYSGRIGIFEFLPISSAIREIVMNNGTSEEINRAAKKMGMKNLREVALEKLLDGVTSLEEIRRVIM